MNKNPFEQAFKDGRKDRLAGLQESPLRRHGWATSAYQSAYYKGWDLVRDTWYIEDNPPKLVQGHLWEPGDV
ncbi:MAG: hypothetical protein ACXABY_18380 [Candidatus Thorarchaeota archaeon]|jgi:hypothetical protein